MGTISGQVAKRIAPSAGGGTVRSILEKAIDGAGPVPGAITSGDAALRKSAGDVDRAVEALIAQHVKLAGAQGFLTNVGGLITMAATIPLNIAGLILLQCHLAASILHVRGYDLSRPAVRDAVLVCLLDSDARKALSKSHGLTISPAALATADPHPETQAAIAQAVTTQLIALSGGKQIAKFVARRIPVLGGAIGGVGDAWSTRHIGREAAKIPRDVTG
ncbi:MAG: EcsC family protein [Nakamurella sp.]